MDSKHAKVDTSSVGNETNPAQTVAEGKGKGKAADIAPHDVSMGEEEDSSDEETGAEDEVCSSIYSYLSGTYSTGLTTHESRRLRHVRLLQTVHHTPRRPVLLTLATASLAEEEDEDNMEEIDTDNIINDGRRTRGKSIDFAKAAENAGDELEDDDEEDDEDFEGGEDEGMQE